MPKKSKHSVRITFRVTPEESAILKRLARSRGYSSISDVVRNILRVRLHIIRELLDDGKVTPCEIGDEIRDMFRTYEEDGQRREFPSDINRRI